MKKMKAAVLYGVGDLRYQDIDIPSISKDEILVKVKSAGICGSDPPRILREWEYELPAIIGHEFAGEVEKVGGNVVGFSKGNRVVVAPLIPCEKCYYCQEGEYSLCIDYGMIGAKQFGAFAEYVVAPKKNVLHIPKNLDYENAAMIEPSAVALHGLRRAGVKLGDEIAIFGMGPIGLLCLQWAKLMGAKRIIAIDVVAEKLELALELGADEVINGLEVDSVEEVKLRTKGLGVDISIEAAGSIITYEQSLRATKRLGKVALLGIARSDINLPEQTFEGIFRKELTVQGFWNSYSSPFPGNEWTDSIEFMDKGLIKTDCLISHRYPLECINDAFEMIGQRKTIYGKVIININH